MQRAIIFCRAKRKKAHRIVMRHRLDTEHTGRTCGNQGRAAANPANLANLKPSTVPHRLAEFAGLAETSGRAWGSRTADRAVESMIVTTDEFCEGLQLLGCSTARSVRPELTVERKSLDNETHSSNAPERRSVRRGLRNQTKKLRRSYVPTPRHGYRTLANEAVCWLIPWTKADFPGLIAGLREVLGGSRVTYGSLKHWRSGCRRLRRGLLQCWL